MKRLESLSFFYLILFAVSTFSIHSLLAESMQSQYKKPSQEEIKSKLNPLQFHVTQAGGTEPAYKNEYWNNHEAGIYVDRVSGEPLFSSLDKYDSGTGWPSFTKPLNSENIVAKIDRKFFFKRTEIRSKVADSHLGHVFDDGPAPTGQRYCMNSAALRFIPTNRLKEEGYGLYLSLFLSKDIKELPKNSKELATFAGGCFWCMEHPFDELPGVLKVTVGYTGGTKLNPTYPEVSSGITGHAESVQIEFDPTKISYENLLEVFWKNIDPIDDRGQFCDKGNQYRSEVFYHSIEQGKLAEKALEEIKAKFSKKKLSVATKLSAASLFYPAEQYHQHYYRKNLVRYKFYRWNCGRDKRLKEIKKILEN
jgi:peptide methionine sulfoxide reductase msrA/msrB